MSRWLGPAFVVAGLVNILGMLLVSRGFSNELLAQAQPQVFSPFGQAMICVWGLAYIAVARAWQALPWLCLVFFVEKMAYVGAWVWWWWASAERFAPIFEQDRLTGLFMAGYGPNDLAFALVFLCAFVLARRQHKAGPPVGRMQAP